MFKKIMRVEGKTVNTTLGRTRIWKATQSISQKKNRYTECGKLTSFFIWGYSYEELASEYIHLKNGRVNIFI
jgi:hypothetical protein